MTEGSATTAGCDYDRFTPAVMSAKAIMERDTRIAELERKLAEQQAVMIKALESPTDAGTESILMDWRNGCSSTPTEELNNLLAKAKEEGKKESVPEGWQVVPKEPTVDMREVLKDRFGGSFLRTKEIYKEMLAATPNDTTNR